MPVLRYLMLLLSIYLIMMLQACGGAGSGGDGVSSSSASLALTVDKTSVAAGDFVSATVKLTSLTGAPVNGVEVSVDVFYQGILLASYPGNTNGPTAGTAVLNFPMTMVNSNRTVSLVARSKGITPSNSQNIAVLAPTLTATLPTSSTMPTPGVAGDSVGLVLGGVSAIFKDGNSNAVIGQTIRFTLVSQTDLSGSLTINGVTLAPGDFIDLIPTDNSGSSSMNVLVVLASSPTASGVNTVSFNYSLSTTYNGMVFVKQGDSMFTVTSP